MFRLTKKPSSRSYCFELTGIINKPLLLRLVGCLYYLYFMILFWDLLNNLNLFLYIMSCI